MTAPNRASVLDALDALPTGQAVSHCLDAILAAVKARDFTSIGGLLVVMGRYDPRKADEVRRKMLNACDGTITLTVDLREATQIALHPRGVPA